MKEPFALLVKAVLSESDAEAHAAWQAWRSAVDIDDLSWPELQLVPLLNGPRLNEWLAADSASGVLMGVVRRTWTEAQVRLSLAQTTMASLERAGCDPVVLFGPAAASLRVRAPAVRPISEIRMLVRRVHVEVALAALVSEGWQVTADVPIGRAMDWSTHVSLSLRGTQLYLHWRVLDVPAGVAAGCERDFLSVLQMVEDRGTTLRLLSPGRTLLAVLSERRDTGTADVIPWQVDAALIPRDDINWKRWAALAVTYCPTALNRLADLRALGVGVPVVRARRNTNSGFVRQLRRVARWLAARVGVE